MGMKRPTRSEQSHPGPRATLIARQMAIDGLIILDSTNVKPIVQTSFRSFPPAYPLIHIDAYSAALEKAARPEDVDPVLLVNLPDAPTACCHLQQRSLIFLCPISGDRELFRCRYSTHICAHTLINAGVIKSIRFMPLHSFAPFWTSSLNTLAKSLHRHLGITLTLSTNSSRKHSMPAGTHSPPLRTPYEISFSLPRSLPKSSPSLACLGYPGHLRTI